MISNREASNKKVRLDQVTFEWTPESELDPAAGLILESLRRRQPPMTSRRR